MRLLLKLEALSDVAQTKEVNSKYYTGMHGWLYKKLKGTDFEELHKKQDFKPFCFGNLYPIRDQKIKEGEKYKVWVSSPDEMFIINLLSNINAEETVNLGEYHFKLSGMKPVPSRKIEEFTLLTTETVTNVCLPVEGSLKPQAITLGKEKNKFKEQLKKNIIRKYNSFSEESIEEDFDLWDNVKIEEIPESETAVKIFFGNKENKNFDVIGSRYKFNMGNISEKQQEIFQLVQDLGFGERNTFGFGFVNMKRQTTK